MPDPKDLFQSFLRAIDGLPPDARTEAVRAFVGVVSSQTRSEQLPRLRAKFVELYGAQHEYVQIVDGQIELRRIREASA